MEDGEKKREGRASERGKKKNFNLASRFSFFFCFCCCCCFSSRLSPFSILHPLPTNQPTNQTKKFETHLSPRSQHEKKGASSPSRSPSTRCSPRSPTLRRRRQRPRRSSSTERRGSLPPPPLRRQAPLPCPRRPYSPPLLLLLLPSRRRSPRPRRPTSGGASPSTASPTGST